MSNDYANHVSSSTCSTCGGPAPDWKCPGCGTVAKQFDPNHWRTCPKEMKMQAMCEKCGAAESKCTCV